MVDKIYRILRTAQGRGRHSDLEPALSRVHREDQDRLAARNRQGSARPAGAQGRQGAFVRRAQDARYGAQLAGEGTLDRQGSSGRENHGRAQDHVRQLGNVATDRHANEETPKGIGSNSGPLFVSRRTSPLVHWTLPPDCALCPAARRSICSIYAAATEIAQPRDIERDEMLRDNRRRRKRDTAQLDTPKAFVPLGGRPLLHYSLRAIAALDGDRRGGGRRCRPGWNGRPAPKSSAPDWKSRSSWSRAAPSARIRCESPLGSPVRRAKSSWCMMPLARSRRPRCSPPASTRRGGPTAQSPRSRSPIRSSASEGRTITATVARDGLWQAQTPQAFRRRMLVEAHDRAHARAMGRDRRRRTGRAMRWAGRGGRKLGHQSEDHDAGRPRDRRGARGTNLCGAAGRITPLLLRRIGRTSSQRAPENRREPLPPCPR